MLAGDLASSTLASTGHPDMGAACDTINDQLREVFAPFIDKAKQALAWALLDRTIAEHERAPIARSSSASAEEKATILLEGFRAIYGDTRFQDEIRNMAKAALITIGRTGESYQEAANEFGVTRACTHAHGRRIEEVTGIKPRRAKSEAARATSVERATGRRKTDDAPRSSVKTSGVLRKTARGFFSFLPGLGVR